MTKKQLLGLAVASLFAMNVAVAAHAEIFHGPLRLRAIEGVRRDADRPHAVLDDAESLFSHVQIKAP